MKIATENVEYIESLNLDHNRKFVLHAALASLRYFQEICSANNLTIHDLTKEYIADELMSLQSVGD